MPQLVEEIPQIPPAPLYERGEPFEGEPNKFGHPTCGHRKSVLGRVKYVLTRYGRVAYRPPGGQGSCRAFWVSMVSIRLFETTQPGAASLGLSNEVYRNLLNPSLRSRAGSKGSAGVSPSPSGRIYLTEH